MEKSCFLQKTINSCELIKNNKDYLTELDSKFGDGDHGYTVSKISDFIEETIDSNKEKSLKQIYEMIGNGILSMGAGSISSLWGMMFMGFSEGIEDEITSQAIKNMFLHAKEKLDIITTAQIGDKSLMDAFLPAYDVATNSNLEVNALLDAMAKASTEGAEKTKEYVSKFGRFKSYGEQTIGTPDPGAISLALFIQGLTTK